MTGCITARARLVAQLFDNRVAFSTSRSIQAACRAMLSLLATRDNLQAWLRHRDPKSKRLLYQRCHSQAPMASCAALGRCMLRWMKVVANKWCKTCLSLGVLTRLKSFPRRTGRSEVLWNRHFVAFPELRCVDAIQLAWRRASVFTVAQRPYKFCALIQRIGWVLVIKIPRPIKSAISR